MIVSLKGEHNHDHEVTELVKNVFIPAVANPFVRGRSFMKDRYNGILNNVGHAAFPQDHQHHPLQEEVGRRRKTAHPFVAAGTR